MHIIKVYSVSRGKTWAANWRVGRNGWIVLFRERIFRRWNPENIWDLGVDKVLGPDGYPLFFFYKFWEVIKQDVIELIHQVGESRAKLDMINYSQIVLIPKKKAPTKMRDFWPIALLNCSVKTISKVLANRMSQVIGELVRDYQSGFIKGRSILNGVAIIKEVIHQCKRIKHKGYLLKLDFEKAYDTINWDCLLEVLYPRGFGPRWIP